MVDILRKSGNLGKELNYILNQLINPNIIYKVDNEIIIEKS